MSSDNVPNQELREAVQRCGLSMSEIGRRMGQPDTRRIRRALGLLRYQQRERSWNGPNAVRYYYQRSLNYDLAVRIMRAIDADPMDVGL